ncbi:MAG: symmetrical bis(5'-nucleosyl)-tetraphosphatase [Nitrospira sp.]|nr:symmetrical bis(5'-nucleosyl)-tetraphosphatase [Nitrospira sp.]MDH5252699.1 symmetrical bis(5'-nucleosyl)-tetraphosphatase [Nitrospira sp.]
MATYAIGDIQGCFNSLRHLLDRVSFQPHVDRLWLVGDLVNRGPESLNVLRYIEQLGQAVRVVIGNHDLFLLAVAEGIVPLRPKDTIQDVLAAPDRDELLAWLRQQPLHHREGEYFMIHAGLLPLWTIKEAIVYAQEVEAVLAGPDYRVFLQQLFHRPTPQWSDNLRGWERLTCITRVLTRLRTCTPTGAMSNFSGPPEDTPTGFAPWFRVPDRRSTNATIITGHWAALGLRLEPNHLAIDSGCVWGRQLTAVRLEDRSVSQVECADRQSSTNVFRQIISDQ